MILIYYKLLEKNTLTEANYPLLSAGQPGQTGTPCSGGPQASTPGN